MFSHTSLGFVFQYQFLNFSGISWYFRNFYLTKECLLLQHVLQSWFQPIVAQTVSKLLRGMMAWGSSEMLGIHPGLTGSTVIQKVVRTIFRVLSSVPLVLWGLGSKCWRAWGWCSPTFGRKNLGLWGVVGFNLRQEAVGLNLHLYTVIVFLERFAAWKWQNTPCCLAALTRFFQPGFAWLRRDLCSAGRGDARVTWHYPTGWSNSKEYWKSCGGDVFSTYSSSLV